jgi:hypothetical protein
VVAIRASGIGWCGALVLAVLADTVSAWSRDSSFGLVAVGSLVVDSGVALGLARELEEHLLEAGTVVGSQLDKRYADGEGDGADPGGVGCGQQPVFADW